VLFRSVNFFMFFYVCVVRYMVVIIIVFLPPLALSRFFT
jgi:hypothetical protein